MKERIRQWQRSNSAPAITAVVATLAIALALLISDAASSQVVRLSVDSAEQNAVRLPGIFATGSAVLAAWGLTLGRRCTDNAIRQRLQHTVVMLAFLLGISLLIGRVTSEPMASIICYSRHAALLSVPLLLFTCTLHTTALDKRQPIKILKIALTIIAIALFALVITNDAHRLVYTRNAPAAGLVLCGPLYAPYPIWTIVLGVASVALLAWKARDIRKWLPILIVIAGAGAAYAASLLVPGRVIPVATTSAAAVFIYAIAIEISVETGFLPSIHRFSTLFRYLPFDLKILNNRGVSVFHTRMSRTLDNTTLYQLAKQVPPDEYDVISIASKTNPDSSYKLYRLIAGIALITVNTRWINERRRELQERKEELMAQNAVLVQAHAVRSVTYRQLREQELYERVEHDLATAVMQIREILDHRLAQVESEQERMQLLNLVKLLVAYCKRKGILALAAAESDAIPAAQLDVITREITADLRSIGIECAILVEARNPVPIADVNTVYDSFYDCILSVLPEADPVVMTYIAAKPDGTLEMRIAIECALGISSEDAVQMIPKIATSTETWTAIQTRIAHELEERLSLHKASFVAEMDEGLINITVWAKRSAEGREMAGVGQ